jgi:hypothetical protein
MKKTIVLAAALLVSFGVLAQGTYNLDNSPLTTGGTVDAKVFDTNGTTPLAGPTFFAQLFIGTVSNSASLTPQGAIVSFYPTGSGGEGYVNPSGTTITSTNVAPGGSGFVQLRAWSGAATYAAAAATGGAKIGSSGILNLTAGGSGAPPSLPANLVGLASFSLTTVVIPEPSTIILGILGGVALLLRRRKTA